MAADPSPRRDAPADNGDDPPGGRNVPAAIASGIALAALFGVLLAVEPLALLAFVAVLAGIALHELDTALRVGGLRPATPVVGGAGIVMLFGGYLHGPPALAVGLVLAVAGSAGWAVVTARLDAAGGDRGHGGVGADLAASALTACWVPLLAGFMGLLLAREHGEWYLTATIALAAVNDVGAYAAGRRFGRRPLAPSVSPAKTWEGLAGGVITTVVLALVVVARLPGFTVALAVALAVVLAVAATVGDLIESLVKRDLGVKDLGTVIPGHGGVMDRVDGILFALPVAHVLLTLVAVA